MISTKISLRARRRLQPKVLLRVPALRMDGKVIFPGIGPMTDDEFIALVQYALRSGYRVYVKDLPDGQAAVPIVKTDGKATLAVSSEFRSQVQGLRAKRKQPCVQKGV
jgi:hypothetical protein